MLLPLTVRASPAAEGGRHPTVLNDEQNDIPQQEPDVHDQQQACKQALAGALGGIAGGSAMTVMMTKVGPRVLPDDVLPDTPAPQKVVQWPQNQAGQPQALTGKPKKAASLAVRLAYSAASGAVYDLARPAAPPLRALPTPAAGVVFGLAVWAVSFQGCCRRSA